MEIVANLSSASGFGGALERDVYIAAAALRTGAGRAAGALGWRRAAALCILVLLLLPLVLAAGLGAAAVC